MTLSNIYIDPIEVPGIIASKMWLRGGSGFDPPMRKGSHQLLSSVLTRGSGPFNKTEIADLVEGCGATLRCDTYEDNLLISLKCTKTDVERLLPIIGWMIIKPHLELDQINLERELSIQALNRQQESPFHIAYDNWRTLAYNSGPYSHDPLGIQSHIKGIKREDLMLISNRIRNVNPVIVFAGSIPNNIRDIINNIEPFKEWGQIISSSNNKVETKYNHKIISTNNSRITVSHQETEQVIIIIGKPTLPHGEEDDLPLRILSCHLGSGMSSLLFTKLREEYGVSYDVGVHFPARAGNSPFLIHCSTSGDKVILTIRLLCEILINLFEKDITNEDLNLAKAKYLGRIAHGSQTSEQRAQRISQLMGLGLKYDYDKISLDRLNSITPQTIRSAAKTYLSKPIISLCGPDTNLKEVINYWDSNF